MTKRLLFICVLAALTAVTVHGQQDNSQDRNRYVVVPRDQGLIVIASQPNCPLTFEDTRLLANMDGLWIPDFRVRNRGIKPIRAFTVAAAGGMEWRWQAPDAAQHLLPGGATKLAGGSSGDEIVPLTESLLEKLNLKGSMKGVVALIVVKVEFDDGSVFQEDSYADLKEYFVKIYLMSNTKKQSIR